MIGFSGSRGGESYRGTSGVGLGTVLVVAALLLGAALWSEGEEPSKSGTGGNTQATLNPLLVHQRPGTWMRLPSKSPMRPGRIHDHAGGAIDPETSVLYFFGSDNHGSEWNNDVWSYNPLTMVWSQSYPEDPPATYRYLDGIKTTTTGHPWAMHSFAMNAWDPVRRQLVVGVWQMHYDLTSLPDVKIPARAGESWWQYDPSGNRWTPALRSPNLDLGHICYVASLKRIIGFDTDNMPVAIYDPEKKSFETFRSFFGGRSPEGYTLRSVYDTKRDRILLLSWDDGPNLWAFDLKKKRWTNLQVKNRPKGSVYGSWDYDQAADAIVSLWPEDPKGQFDNPSGKSRTFVIDLTQNAYREIKTQPAAPYTGMSYRVLYDARHEVTFAVEGNTVWSFKAPVPEAR